MANDYGENHPSQAPKKALPCPVCAFPTLTPHCPPTNAVCTWDACNNPRCRSFVDRRNPIRRHSHPILSHCITCGPITHRGR